ncbi:WXG100 family type VII secretion target [Streptacidiphilus monticola]
MTYYDPTAEQQIYQYQQQQQQQADNQWKSVEQQHRGGSQPGHGGFTTDFESHGGGLKGLRNMIMHTDPEAMHNVAARWTAIHDSLNETAGQLKTHVNNLLENWSGDSAEAFRTNATNLHTSLTNGAQYAQNASAAMSDAAFALQEAKNNMPDEPSLWDRGSRALTSERQDWQFKQDAAQYGLEAALKKDGGQLSANEEAHQQAVVVMEKLGTKYNEASAKLDERPVRGGDGGVWPPAPSKTYQPVGSSGGTSTSPKHEGMVTGHGGDPGGHGGVTGVRDPGTGGTTHYPTDPTGGIHGGSGGGNVPNPTTTIDGGPGGPHSGGGLDHGTGGDPNYHGIGLGDGGGGGAANGAHGGLYGGMGPLGTGGAGEGGSGWRSSRQPTRRSSRRRRPWSRSRERGSTGGSQRPPCSGQGARSC